MIEEKKDTFVALSILLIWASLAYLPFVYRGTLGEWDSFRMANGVIHSITTGHPFKSPLLYNLKISFGYYALLYLFTFIFKTNLALVITFMNYINAICAILMVPPLFFTVKRYWGNTAAVLANVLLMFIPSWWNLSLYGHPMTQAMLFMFIGLALIGYRSQLTSLKAAPWKLIALDVSIIFAFSLSLVFRLDAVLMFPLITACLLLERYSFKAVVLRSMLYGFLPLIVFFVAQSIIPDFDTATSSPNTIVQLLLAWHNLSRIVPNLLRALAIGALACHPLYLLAFCVSCLYLAYKRSYLALFFILPAFVLNFLFWIPNPSPARHFVYMAPVLAVGIAIWLSGVPWGTTSLTKYGRVFTPIPAVILFVAASLISSELMYPIVRANYPWKTAPQNYSARAYIRSIFINKYYSEKYFHDVARFGRDLHQLGPKDRPVFVIADARPVLLQLQLLSKDVQTQIERIDSTSTPLILHIVENKSNTFILVEGNLVELIHEENDYNESYLAVDKHNPNNATFNISDVIPPLRLVPELSDSG